MTLRTAFLALFLASHTVSLCFVSEGFAKTHKAEKIAQKARKEKANTDALAKDGEDVAAIKVYAGATLPHLLSKQAIVMDASSHTILLDKNAHVRMSPSSMTKMMTSYLLEEKILKGDISEDTEFPVSHKAWKTGGSKTFVPLNGMVRVIDLLRGIVIQSGNDASIVAAEGLAGSEENFAELMNAKARIMGMKDTHFVNASGLHADGHYSTAHDIARLGLHVVQDHPKFYSIYSEKEFTFGVTAKGKPITQGNRNPALYWKDITCDGIKTGHTDEGGYGIALSFIEDGQRYIAVINGLKSQQARANEARTLIQWIRQNFTNKAIYKKGDVVEESAKVWLGTHRTIPLVIQNDITFLTLRGSSDKPNLELQYPTPINAPILKGDVVGKAVLKTGHKVIEVPLLAGESCEKVGMIARFFRSLGHLIWGTG